MNIFQNYRATKYYLEILESLDPSLRAKFTIMVKAKFYEKVTGDEELESYKITEKDLEALEAKITS